jgi:hypothetical protein
MNIGSTVRVLVGGPRYIAGMTGRIGYVCEDGVTVLVEIDGVYEPTFRAWPVAKWHVEEIE